MNFQSETLSFHMVFCCLLEPGSSLYSPYYFFPEICLIVTSAGQRFLGSISGTSGLGQRPVPWACLDVATWFGRSGEFNNMLEARLCHLLSGWGTDGPGLWVCVRVHRGIGQDIWDKMIEKEIDYSKLCLASRWLGALHLQCDSLIYSETRTGKIPLRNPEPWPWLTSLNEHQQNTSRSSLYGRTEIPWRNGNPVTWTTK